MNDIQQRREQRAGVELAELRADIHELAGRFEAAGMDATAWEIRNLVGEA